MTILPRLRAVTLVILYAVASPNSAAQEAGSIVLEEAARTFAEFDAACTRDNGELWGISLCGPVLLVDPQSRSVVTNAPDREGLLESRGAVWVGKLPPEKLLGNATLDWGGVKWAMIVVTFLGNTPGDRVTLLAHESFHRVQASLQLMAPGELNGHLDLPDGRYWMQLEWNALQAALAAEGTAQRSAIEDALAFRAFRRGLYPPAATRECRLEIHEGLPQYTGMRIAGRTGQELLDAVAARRAKEDGFVRSFAYTSGPLYGCLLDKVNAKWRTIVRSDSDLGQMLAQSVGITPSGERAAEAARRYGGEVLRAAEDEREHTRQARLAVWRTALVDGPVLVLDLSGKFTGTSDSRQTHTFDDGRTVSTKRTIVAEWGRLEINGAPMLEDAKLRQGRVSLKGASHSQMSGEGWVLQLDEGWKLAPSEREGDVTLRRSK